ncbi:MAG: hypothetical protein IJX64_01040 [Clostridia bacterium]|nr:hypothetical protein [Clostridia bacterium]
MDIKNHRSAKRILTALVAVLALCICLFAAQYSLVGLVVEIRENCVIVEVLNEDFYRFSQPLHTPKVKLYTQNAAKYSVGQTIFSYTSDSSEDSIPLGIRSYFDVRLSS